jgi:hypothetical protein
MPARLMLLSLIRARGSCVRLSKTSDFTREARLLVEQPGKTGAGTYHPALQAKLERGTYVMPLNNETTWLDLVESHE